MVDPQGAWYVLRVTYQRELPTKEALTRLGIETFVPERVVRRRDRRGRFCTVREAVLHNYIFVRTTKRVIDELKTFRLPMLRYVMHMEEGFNRPMIVPEAQMRHFMAVAGSPEPRILYLTPSELDLAKGDRVRITGGPLRRGRGHPAADPPGPRTPRHRLDRGRRSRGHDIGARLADREDPLMPGTPLHLTTDTHMGSHIFAQTTLLPFLTALLCVGIAHLKDIVDVPDARKLQRTPIPIMGGICVFLGGITGIGISNLFETNADLLVVVMAMTVMLYTGTVDDILGLSPHIRLVIEILTVLCLIGIGGYLLNDFHGLWGLGVIPMWAAVPLTLFAAVGIINAINLIDGVDGLSSGFCIMACLMFGWLFYLAGDTSMTILPPCRPGRSSPSSCTTSTARARRCSSATAEPSCWGSSSRSS